MPAQLLTFRRPGPRLRLLAAGSAVLLGGCGGGAPAFVVAGAYVPAWLVCLLIGIVAAALAHGLLAASGALPQLPLPLWVCAGVGVIAAALSWLAIV